MTVVAVGLLFEDILPMPLEIASADIEVIQNDVTAGDRTNGRFEHSEEGLGETVADRQNVKRLHSGRSGPVFIGPNGISRHQGKDGRDQK